MTIYFPDNAYEIIDGIRNAIGREVVFYSGISTICPVCSGLDPYTGYALDPFCQTCSGTGLITTYSGTGIIAHVTWGYSDELQILRGGTFESGKCRLQIKYTPENDNITNLAKYIVVDGKRVGIERKIYRGVKQINRIILDCFTEE